MHQPSDVRARGVYADNAYEEAAFTHANCTIMSHEAGRRVLLEGRAKHFDPQLVDVLLEYLDGIATADTEVALSPRHIRPGMVLSRDVRNTEGILLLRKGMRLAEQHIERVHTLSEINPLLARIFVRCSAERASLAVGDEHCRPPAEDTPGCDGGAPLSLSETCAEQPDAPLARKPGIRTEPTPSPGMESRSVQRCRSRRPDGRATTVLIVGDSRLVGNALARHFRRAGLHSIAADNGWDALALLGTHRFDAAVVDLALPSMFGKELLDRLRDQAPDLPCVVLTANATRQKVLQLSRAANVAGIIVKPWDYDRLISIIVQAINEHGCGKAKELI